MKKLITAIGLMSGTSMDGIDASIIQSDGETEYNVILNKYFEYDSNLYKMLSKIRDKVEKSKDLITLSKELLQLEKEISLFHAKISNEIIKGKVIKKVMKEIMKYFTLTPPSHSIINPLDAIKDSSIGFLKCF